MKKLSIFAVLALFVLGLATAAQAADIKAYGKWQIDAALRDNNDFLGKGAATGEEQGFNIEQRIRAGFQFIANENLKGVLELQIGTNNWGNGVYQIGAGRSANTDAATASANGIGQGNVMLRKGYIDFKWPGTKVNFMVGYQGVNLPTAFGGGSAILDDQAAAAIVSTPLTDNLKLLAGYIRVADAHNAGATTTSNFGSGASADAVFAALPIDFKGYNITPFGAYLNAGYQSGVGSSLAGFAGPNSSTVEGLRGYWGGVAFTMTAFDPFKLMADFNYGKVTYNNTVSKNAADGGRSGFLFDVALDYTGLSMMTPEVFFAYSSGEGGNSTQKDSSGRMPVIANPQGWTVNNSFFFGDRDFINGFGSNAGYARNVMGFWTAGVSLKNIKLIDKLTHNVNLLYIKGTNDPDYLKDTNVRAASYGAFLTTKDHLWEIDVNTKYQIYDELSLALNLGYINADIDKDTWGASTLKYHNDYRNYGSKDAYRAGLALNYVF